MRMQVIEDYCIDRVDFKERLSKFMNAVQPLSAICAHAMLCHVGLCHVMVCVCLCVCVCVCVCVLAYVRACVGGCGLLPFSAIDEDSFLILCLFFAGQDEQQTQQSAVTTTTTTTMTLAQIPMITGMLKNNK